jgi:hypothetical protein
MNKEELHAYNGYLRVVPRCLNELLFSKETVEEGNIAFPKSKSGLEVKTSRVCDGLGVFATREFPRDYTVCEYFGEILTEQQVRDKRKRNPSYDATYLLQLTHDCNIDPDKATDGGVARYINDILPQQVEKAGAHKKQPHNVIYVNNLVKNKVTVKTTRRVKEGEELYVKYGAGYWRGRGETEGYWPSSGHVRRYIPPQKMPAPGTHTHHGRETRRQRVLPRQEDEAGDE